MVNVSEQPLNTVTPNRPKTLIRPEPKWHSSRTFLCPGWECTDIDLPVERLDLTHHVTYAKHGKPVSLPEWVGRPQGPTMAMQVEEGGKSESCPVMRQIGIEPKATSPVRKRADFRLVSHCKETEANLLEKEEAEYRIKKLSAVSSGKLEMGWHQDQLVQTHQHVKRLQLRIAKATREGKTSERCKPLQRLLTRSFHAKVLAVKRVTENQGKATPGSTAITWSTPESKLQAVFVPQSARLQPLPLRGVYIPKSNGKKRPLGIPTMKDRAMQALHKLALEPVAESLADKNSYGFRPERALRTPLDSATLSSLTRCVPNGYSKATSKVCFDEISHDWLMNNVPMDKIILRKWLKAGYIDYKKEKLYSPQ